VEFKVITKSGSGRTFKWSFHAIRFCILVGRLTGKRIRLSNFTIKFEEITSFGANHRNTGLTTKRVPGLCFNVFRQGQFKQHQGAADNKSQICWSCGGYGRFKVLGLATEWSRHSTRDMTWGALGMCSRFARQLGYGLTLSKVRVGKGPSAAVSCGSI